MDRHDLLDEFDSFGKDNSDLRNVINAGHTRDKPVIRCNPLTNEPQDFDLFCPKAIGLIGKLPETLQDRSIEIRLEPRAKSQRIEPMRTTKLEQYAHVRRKLMRWTSDHLDEIRRARPEIPETLNDGEADNWLSLLAVAKVAEGEWPKRVQEAISAHSG